MLAFGVAAVAGLAIALLYDDGPYRFQRRPFEWRRVGRVLAHRETRLATAGYLGHMWELYAMWTWTAAFLTASALAGGYGTGWVPTATFAIIGIGGAGRPPANPVSTESPYIILSADAFYV